MENKFKTVLVDFEGDCVYPNYDEARQFYADINDVDLRWVVELSALEAANAEITDLRMSISENEGLYLEAKNNWLENVALKSENKKLSDENLRLRELLEEIKSGSRRFANYVIEYSREDAYNNVEAKKFIKELEDLEPAPPSKKD